MKSNIEELLPHRFPFLFVDEIISANKSQIVGLKKFSKTKDYMLTGSFPSYEYIPGMIIIEAMAQCGGAGIKQLGLANGLFGLVGINNVEFFKGVTYNQEIKFVIDNIRISNRIIKQCGKAYHNAELLADASWICARLDL